MRIGARCVHSLSVIALSTLVWSATAFAGPLGGKVKLRPLSDFLTTQGTTATFFPPVPDYGGWTNGEFTTFALVDYAGLANEYLGGGIGTKVKGLVAERRLPDGRAQINVVLHTTRAVGFAQSIEDLAANGFDFDSTPTIFGSKVKDIEHGAPAAVGPATLNVSFMIAAPGAPLPNLIDVLNASADYAPVKLQFKSTSVDRSHAQLRIQQNASTDATGSLIFTTEVIEIAP